MQGRGGAGLRGKMSGDQVPAGVRHQGAGGQRGAGGDDAVHQHGHACRGAAAALHHLGLQPLLNLGLRLGEGSGATLAIPLVQAAARVLSEMATFDEAAVGHAPAAGQDVIPEAAPTMAT
jgi:nicotinate-nucleotide--dimethylbenzimidazole phosphoribosyltransferase